MNIQEIAALSFWDMTPQEARDRINQRILAVEAEPWAVYDVSDISISREGRNTPLRIYKPNDELDLPVVLFIHGGGWVGGNIRYP